MQTRRVRRAAGTALVAIALSGVGIPAAAGGTAPKMEMARGPVTSLPLPRYVSIRADVANARRGPGLDYRIDWEFVRRGLPVEVTAEYGHWRRIRDVQGLGGWVHHSLLSGARTGLVQGEGNAAFRASPSDDALVLALAEPGVVTGIERCSGAWCEVTTGSVSGWIRRDRLWGVGPDEEID
jgi:SH3-like domain-containing protein